MFRIIPFTSGQYEINEDSVIRSTPRKVERFINGIDKSFFISGKILKQRLKDGYVVCDITFDGSSKPCKVHRLLALAFIPLVPGKNYINHKNGIRSDNRLENLEWCTQKENINHSRNILGNKHLAENRRGKYNVNSKPVIAIHIITGEIINFESCRLAADSLGLTFQNIYHNIKGDSKRAGQYHFKFINDVHSNTQRG